MRLIDADRLYENIYDNIPAPYEDSREAKEECLCAIEEAPTVDAVPVVHGRWIEQEKYTFGVMYDCSICDNRILDNGHSWNYCPNCGAKMDGK